MSRPVIVLMGSDSDLPIVRNCLETLDRFAIGYDVRVLSAHRTPRQFHEFAATLDASGYQVILGAAGRAAHLAGVLASLTVKPVIAIPIESGSLQGIDALYSTLQMPSGIPVATMALGKAGAVNAGVFAAQVLALHDPALRQRLVTYKKELADQVIERDRQVQVEFAQQRKA